MLWSNQFVWLLCTFPENTSICLKLLFFGWSSFIWLHYGRWILTHNLVNILIENFWYFGLFYQEKPYYFSWLIKMVLGQIQLTCMGWWKHKVGYQIHHLAIVLFSQVYMHYWQLYNFNLNNLNYTHSWNLLLV